MSIFKDCDIRGIYGRELTAEDTYKIGRALATLSPGKILVGGDVRLSTPELKGELIRGLLASGAELTDLGTIPTPALYFALKMSDVQAGCTVTASHNPPEYNGVKYMIGHNPVTRTVMDQLQAIVESGNFAEKQGSIAPRNIIAEYLDFLAERFTAPRKLHVLVGRRRLPGPQPQSRRLQLSGQNQPGRGGMRRGFRRGL